MKSAARVIELLAEEKRLLTPSQTDQLIDDVLDELLGLGPLEPLLKDDTITDILINTHDTVYVERGGRLELTDVQFQDTRHLVRIINKIVSAVGRRVDESSADGRRAPGRRQPGQRHHPAAGGRRPAGLDPQIRRDARSNGPAGRASAASPPRWPRCCRRSSRRGATC